VVPRAPLRIAVVQFAPKIGQVHVNMARAREICAKYVVQERTMIS